MNKLKKNYILTKIKFDKLNKVSINKIKYIYIYIYIYILIKIKY